MSALTDYFENKLIDFTLRGQALGVAGSSAGVGSGPTTVYISALTTVNNDAGSAHVEVTGGSYARVAVACSLANWAGTQGAGTTTISTGSSGLTSNNNAITFPAPTADWGTVTAFEICDASTGGNALAYAALDLARLVSAGDPAPNFPAGSLQFRIDN